MRERTRNRNILRPALTLMATGLATAALSACSESSEKNTKPVDPDSFQCTESGIINSETAPIITFATKNGQADKAEVYISTQKVLDVEQRELADGKFRAGVLTAAVNTVTLKVMSGDEIAECPAIHP